MQADLLYKIKVKLGSIISGIFLETYLFQGQDTSESLGPLLYKVGLFITFLDSGTLWLHSGSPDGQSLNFTLDNTVTPIPNGHTTLVDLG
jgi:hypothetical protein